MLPPGRGLGRAAPQPAHRTQLSLSFWLPGEPLWFTALCKGDPIEIAVRSTAKQNAFKEGKKKVLDPFSKLPFEEKRVQHTELVRFQKRQPCTEILWWRTVCGSDTEEIMSLAFEKKLHNSLKLLHQGGLKI